MLQDLNRCRNGALLLQQELAGVSRLAFETNPIFLHLFIPVKMSSHSILLGSGLDPLLSFQYEDTNLLLCFT